MRKHSKTLVGIIGVGFVGGAVLKYFQSKKLPIRLYDKYKALGSPEEVNEADIIFISTPTPFDKKRGFDLSAVEDAIRLLKKPKIVVIKSSIVPGTTESLQKKYPKHKFLFNPEFLREATAYHDFINPDRQIVGFTKQSRGVARRVLELLPKAPYRQIMPAGEAELVKYMGNAFLALKVVYANEIYDLAKALGLDYQTVREGVSADLRIGPSHLRVEHGGYRGYGGRCLPKDVNALIQLAEKKKVNTSLLKAMRAVNREFLKKSGVNEAIFLDNVPKKRKINNG